MSPIAFNSLLVPVDFSNASIEAIQQAVLLTSRSNADGPGVIALHVIDEGLIELMTENGLEERESLVARLRERAGERLGALTSSMKAEVQVDCVVSVGKPFLEIIQKSEDFDVDAIVMGKVAASDSFEKLLFGSTAERVLRGSKRPVIVLPKSEA